MKKLLLSLTVIFTLLAAGCTTLNVTKFIEIDYQKEVDKGAVIDAISYVLLDNGFEIENINETYGMITTGWKDLHTETRNIGLTLLTASKYSSTLYSDAVKLTFRLTESGYTVYPKQSRISSTSNSLVRSSSSNELTPQENSIAGKLTSKVISEINELIDQPTQIVWQEESTEFE